MPMVKVAHAAWPCVWWNVFWRREDGGRDFFGLRKRRFFFWVKWKVVETTNGLVKLVSWVDEVGYCSWVGEVGLFSCLVWLTVCHISSRRNVLCCWESEPRTTILTIDLT